MVSNLENYKSTMNDYILLYKKATIIFFSFSILLSSCRKTAFVKSANQSSNAVTKYKPNIILILADDIGYEIPTCDGGQSYTTPAIDNLAAKGVRFTQCHVCPNCSPSRVELLTGKYGFRNYKHWGILNAAQKTFANMLHDAGYKTCVAGKWQLDGGNASIKNFGFDNYRVFEPYATDNENLENKYRYKNPRLFENGNFLADSLTKGKYADNMFTDYISNFIDSNLNNPFFIYYPMSLCHAPFSPTPDDAEYAAWNPLTDSSDLTFFPSMIKYMDKKVKQVENKINDVGLTKKTIIIFMGDNGTDLDITSMFNGQAITGGKATSTIYGTHVPLIISNPGRFLSGITSGGLIDASDFLPTLASMAKIKTPDTYGPLDGISFYPLLLGSTERLRDWIYCHWNSQKGVWVQDETYKLYDSTGSSHFFNIFKDPLELKPIPNKKLSAYETQRKNTFDSVLNAMHN